jgi:hypothetical protein
MASVDGEFVSIRPPENFQGIMLRFNPKTGHLFVDENCFAVNKADEVVVLGHRVYARGKIEYFSEINAPKPLRNVPTEVKYKSSNDILCIVNSYHRKKLSI